MELQHDFSLSFGNAKRNITINFYFPIQLFWLIVDLVLKADVIIALLKY